jgi:subtilisin family serine protease
MVDRIAVEEPRRPARPAWVVAAVLALAVLLFGALFIPRFLGRGGEPGGGSDGAAVDADIVPGRYIVWVEASGGKAVLPDLAAGERLRAAYRDQLIDLVEKGHGRRLYEFDTVLVGFSADMSPSLARAVRAKATKLEALVPGLRVHVDPAHRVRLATTQLTPPYGLDRISERAGCLNGQFTYSLTGKGAHVYVIDTGIVRLHPEFMIGAGQSRVTPAVFNAFNDGKEDDQGHGTHVAGTIGGKTYGVAKEVTLHPVRVFKLGVVSDTTLVIKGIEEATKHAVARGYERYSVVNLSLTSLKDNALNKSIEDSIAKNLTFVVAAGNRDAQHLDRNSCNASPASATNAISVGASNPGDDKIADFSFVGSCVDIFAPGVYILSASNDPNGPAVFMHGASAAAAHVSGIAALYLGSRVGQSGPKPTPAAVWQAVFGAGSKYPQTQGWAGIRGNLWNSPNRLTHWGSASANGVNDGEVCTP